MSKKPACPVCGNPISKGNHSACDTLDDMFKALRSDIDGEPYQADADTAEAMRRLREQG